MELGQKPTTDELMNTLLDCGLVCSQREREQRLAAGSVPHLSEENVQREIESVLKQERTK